MSHIPVVACPPPKGEPSAQGAANYGGDIEVGGDQFGLPPPGCGPDDIPLDQLRSNGLPAGIYNGFFVKVYALTGVYLLISSAVSIIFFFSDEAAAFLSDQAWLVLVCGVVAMSMFAVLYFNCIQSHLISFVLVVAGCVIWGYVIAGYVILLELIGLLVGIGCTVGIGLAVLLLVLNTQFDFLGLYNRYWIAFLVSFIVHLTLVVVSVLNAVFILGLINAIFGCLLYSMVLVILTQSIAPRQSGEVYDIDDYIQASVVLYMYFTYVYLDLSVVVYLVSFS